MKTYSGLKKLGLAGAMLLALSAPATGQGYREGLYQTSRGSCTIKNKEGRSNITCMEKKAGSDILYNGREGSLSEITISYHDGRSESYMIVSPLEAKALRKVKGILSRDDPRAVRYQGDFRQFLDHTQKSGSSGPRTFREIRPPE